MDLSITSVYEKFETQHWWHVVRRDIIRQFIDRAIEGRNQNVRWLDIGCATGILLASCPRITDKLGVESHEPFVEAGRARGIDIRQTGARWDLEPLGKFDLVTLCDVLEHIEDEQEAMAAIYKVLNPGGILLVTVPALMSLWSGHDVAAHHCRRYDRRSLTRLFQGNGWRVKYASYYSSFLLPAIWMFRKFKNMRSRRACGEVSHDLAFGPPAVDWVLRMIFRAEAMCLRFMRMPLGSSLILIAAKEGD
jgi:SAM-dependent methyltransferase